MKLTIGDKSYELDLTEIANGEAIALERETGRNFFDWLRDVTNRPSMADATALVWLLDRRINPALSIDDVHFTAGEWLNRTEDWSTPDADAGEAVAPPTSTG